VSTIPSEASRVTHDVDGLRETREADVLVLPHEQVEPGDKGKHVGIIVCLLQAVLRVTLFIVPHAPLRSAQPMRRFPAASPALTSSNAIFTSRGGIPCDACWMLARSMRDLQISMLRSAAYIVSPLRGRCGGDSRPGRRRSSRSRGRVAG
jgi:hypothetical protein